MNISDSIPILGISVTLITFISGIIMYWMDLKLKPIKKRLDEIEKQNIRLEETMSQIVDGLLSNDQIPRGR